MHANCHVAHQSARTLFLFVCPCCCAVAKPTIIVEQCGTCLVPDKAEDFRWIRGSKDGSWWQRRRRDRGTDSPNKNGPLEADLRTYPGILRKHPREMRVQYGYVLVVSWHVFSPQVWQVRPLWSFFVLTIGYVWIGSLHTSDDWWNNAEPACRDTALKKVVSLAPKKHQLSSNNHMQLFLYGRPAGPYFPMAAASHFMGQKWESPGFQVHYSCILQSAFRVNDLVAGQYTNLLQPQWQFLEEFQ